MYKLINNEAFSSKFFFKIISIFFIVLIFISIFFLLFLSYKPIKIQDYSFINKYLINFDDLKIKNTGDIFLSFNKSSKNFELIVEDFETEENNNKIHLLNYFIIQLLYL